MRIQSVEQIILRAAVMDLDFIVYLLWFVNLLILIIILWLHKIKSLFQEIHPDVSRVQRGIMY